MTLFTTIGINAFAQEGYVLFVTPKNYVYDEFITPGIGVVSPGDVTVTFLWAPVETPDPLGSGVPTSGISNVGSGWSTVASMLSSGWTVAQNASSGNAEADVAVTSQGGINYNGGSDFPAENMTGGNAYEFVVIGWDNLTGAATLENAMGDEVPMAWSNPFDYATGATVTATVEEFSESGMNPFGVAPVPEPASLALAGLGGFSLLFIRRRKS